MTNRQAMGYLKFAAYWLRKSGIPASSNEGQQSLAKKLKMPAPITQKRARYFLKNFRFENIDKPIPLVGNFYASPAWRKLRYKALLKYGRKCLCCGSEVGSFHVDHIKPRSKYPELELKLSNLQILCEDCNMGKGAWDETDFRS